MNRGLIILFLLSNIHAFGQKATWGVSIGGSKYIYQNAYRADKRSRDINEAQCYAGLERPQQSRWISPDFGAYLMYPIKDWFQLSGGLRFSSKGKDVISPSNLSCSDKYPIIQIRTTYLQVPLFFQTDPNVFISMRIGIAYGLPLWHREIHNDRIRVEISEPIFKKTFTESKEVTVELVLRFNKFLTVNGGLFKGYDIIEARVGQPDINYYGYRMQMQYNLTALIKSTKSKT